MNPLALFAVFGIILCSMPFVAGVGVATVVALHFWVGLSWWWALIPVAVFVGWCYATKDG
jgi:hypothetical protein